MMKNTFFKKKGYWLILPALLWIGITMIYPFFLGLRIAFYRSTYRLTTDEFIGLENFNAIFKDERFWIALWNSSIWTMSNVALFIPISWGAGLLLNTEFKGRSVIRTLFLIPWIIPSVVSALMWRWLLDPDLGIVNYLLMYLNIVNKPILFLVSRDSAMFTCVLINLWKFIPFPTILVLATLQTIPKELYDAASIDGASALQQFRYITYPHLKRILTVMGILGFIWTFNSFDIPYLLTEGGPGNATETLPLFIYRKAFLEFRLGEAAATTLIMFIILLAYTLLHFKFGVFAIPLTIFSTLLICILHNLGWV